MLINRFGTHFDLGVHHEICGPPRFIGIARKTQFIILSSDYITIGQLCDANSDVKAGKARFIDKRTNGLIIR